MSVTTSIANAIKARLQATTELAGIDVIVWEQQDLTSVVQKALNSRRGTGIVIAFEGFDNKDDAYQGLLSNILRRYSVQVVARRVIGTQGTLAPDIVEAAAIAINNWDISTVVASAAETHIRGCTLDQAPEAISYILDLEVESKLTS